MRTASLPVRSTDASKMAGVWLRNVIKFYPGMQIEATFHGRNSEGRERLLESFQRFHKLFFFKLNCYRITPGTDIDEAKKNGSQAQGPQHKGIIADVKIIKEI